MTSTVITFNKLTEGNRVGAVDVFGFKLPFPRNMEVETEYMWEAQELGMIGSALARGGFQNLDINSSDSIESFMAQVGSKAVSGAAAAAASAGSNSGAFQGAMASQRSAINPKEEVLFKGVKHRRFNMIFDLAPFTATDSLNVFAFLKKLHMLAAPEVSEGSAFYKYPETLSVVVNGGEGVIINRGNCAVTGINVNMSPEQIWATFHDGRPVHIVITISFIELDLPSRSKDATLFG